MLLIKEVRNSREESRTSQQGLHKRFCSTRNTSVKAKWQVWMDMKGDKPNQSNLCTTSISFYLRQSFLLMLCASPRVLQSTIWADKPKFTVTANKQILSALSGKGRWEQISDVPLAAVCPNLNSFVTLQNLLSLPLTVEAGHFWQACQPFGHSLKWFLQYLKQYKADVLHCRRQHCCFYAR